MTVIKGETRKIFKIDNQVIKIAFPFFLGLFIFILSLSKKEINFPLDEVQSNHPLFALFWTGHCWTLIAHESHSPN